MSAAFITQTSNINNESYDSVYRSLSLQQQVTSNNNNNNNNMSPGLQYRSVAIDVKQQQSNNMNFWWIIYASNST